MKKLIAGLCAGGLALALLGCGGGDKKPTPPPVKPPVKTDAPKTDAPKTDAPKTDAPKTDAPAPAPKP